MGSDLKSDRTKLEQQVPKLLKQLVDAGQLMPVEAEYRLQTREGARWTHDFNRRRTAALNDERRTRKVKWMKGVKMTESPIDPVFRADTVVLAISAEKNGNLRVVYARIGRCQGRPA
jgi:hypothetical protein